jgi:hypothetical protein
LGGVTLTCDFVTLAASNVRLHTLDFLGGHAGRVVDGEGPEQSALDGFVNLSGSHAEDLADLSDGVGTKARHAGSFLCGDEPTVMTIAARPVARLAQEAYAFGTL